MLWSGAKRGQEQDKCEDRIEENSQKNIKFLLIVAQCTQILRGVAEVMYGRLSEGEASRRGAWFVVRCKLDECEWGTYSK